MKRITLPFFALFLIGLAHPQVPGSPNLAPLAIPSASEQLSDEMAPKKAIDGNPATRWSGIPGHNAGVWFELDWPKPVAVGEVVVHQYERYAFEWDVQTWDDDGGRWLDAGHYGKPNERLPLAVVCPISPVRSTTKIRIANITNGPSFTEVEVYSDALHHKPVISMASDLRGNFVGMLCDAFGGAPVPNQPVTVSGDSLQGRWTATAKSDEHGLFWAPMPVGIRGAVQATSPQAESSHFIADGFQRAITPISSEAKVMDLNIGWKFRTDPPAGFEKPEFKDSSWSPIRVPAHWTMEGFRGDSGGYRRWFSVAKGSGRLMLRFDGVYSGADVWVNGSHVAYHEGGFTPFEADVTDVLTPGSNLLAVRVTEHSNVSDNLDKMSLYADFALAGIMRKVTLFRVPDVHVEAYGVATEFTPDLKSAHITGHVVVVNRSRQALRSFRIGIALVDPIGRTITTTGTALPAIPLNASAGAPFDVTLQNPKPWNAEHPNLYRLSFTLDTDAPRRQLLFQWIGLRQTEIRGTEILIDKSPVKFRGTCHHDQYPTLGRAVTPALEKLDLQMIKEANLNSVRTSHYPPMPELIADADRMGVYVEDEADFCWVGVSDDLRNTPRIIQLEGELLARDRNHPSVFIWSLCNESTFGYGFDRAHEFVRAADPSRPNSAATSAWLEVATEHNPISIARLNDVAKIDKPLLWDESWCIYQGIFGDVAEMWVDPGMRNYYAAPLPKIWDAFMASKTVSGSMIWAWSDDLFCVPGTSAEYGRGTAQSHFIDDQYSMPGRGIVGDAPWGVVDGWRRRKPEFWITKKLQSPVRMDEKPYRIVGNAGLTEVSLPVENQFDFMNLSELKITWSCGSLYGTAIADIPARSNGRLTIHATALKGSDPLNVAFRDAEGHLIDEFVFPPSKMADDAAFAVSKPLTVHDESILAGDVTYITGSGFGLAFEKEHGWLRRCVAGTSPLFLDFPAIHVLPTATPLSSSPKQTEWRLDDFYLGKEGQNVRVTQGGHYDNFKGGYEWTIEPTGKATVHAKFTYTGPDVLAREVGMSFSLPRGCTELSWNSHGEWGAYPSDHIGRTQGTAKAFYGHGTAVPPTWPWSEDDSPMGSNDFRSTKRNVTTCRIGYPGGASIDLESDGAHALRACVDTDRVTVSLNDWYGGTNVGWGEWISNYGRGKLLKSGDVIESTLRFYLNPGPKR